MERISDRYIKLYKWGGKSRHIRNNPVFNSSCSSTLDGYVLRPSVHSQTNWIFFTFQGDMVTLRKQMRAFCLMCQHYLSSVNTAVKEQVGLHLRDCSFIPYLLTWPLSSISANFFIFFKKSWILVFLPGLHHTVWSAADLQSPNNVFRPGTAGVSGLYARHFLAGRAPQLHSGSGVHWSGWWQ